MSPRPGGDVSNSSEFATMGSGEFRAEMERRKSAGALALDIARRHTSLILILTYLTATVIARLQELWFFRFFRVNILNYSDPQDFLLASMRRPTVWTSLLVPTALLLLVSWLLARRKSIAVPEGRRSPVAFSWNTPGLRLMFGVVVVIAVAAGVARMNAGKRFEAVNAGRGRHVTFARTDGITHNEQPLLIGSSSKFFFLYYAGRKVTEIVPVENTALMTVDLESRK
jgi:hypothetical protein